MKTNDFIEVELDSTHTFSYFKEKNNKIVIPSTATISIIDTAANEIITDQSMTIDGATGVVTYAWDSEGYGVGKNYQVIYKIDSRLPVVRFFDIYKYPFVIDVTDDDLIDENSAIKKGGWQLSGKSQSGTTLTIVDGDAIGNNDTWDGGLIEIFQDQNVETRKVSGFATGTGTFTFAPALQTAASTNEYIVRKSFQEKINIAGIKVQKDFKALNKRAYLVIDHLQVKWLIIYKFFQDYFGNLVKELDDEYDIQHEKYAKLYKNEFQSLSLVYDENADSIIDDNEVNKKVGAVRWLR